MFNKKTKQLEQKIMELEDRQEFDTFDFKRLIDNINTLAENKDFDCIKYIIKTFTEYLSFKEATQSLLLENKHGVIFNDNLQDILQSLVYTFDFKNIQKTCDITFTINELNLLLNPWNEDRIISNLKNINQNNILKPHYNIENYYLYPLDITVCCGGNHSQLSAKIQNQGTTHITHIHDFSELYKHVTFNGKSFVESNNKNEVIRVNNEVGYFAGVFFEIGRILNDPKNKDYFNQEFIGKINE